MNKWWRLGSLVQCLAALGAYCTSAVAQDVVIEHVTVVSPERSSALTDATVVIRGERIASISNNTRPAAPSETTTRVIDGRGLFLSPGLIDSHVHSGGVPGMTFAQQQAHPGIARAAREQVPRSYLYFGFTTLVDLDARPAQTKQWDGYAAHPDIYSCGAAPVIDGYPMNDAPKPARYEAWPYMLIQSGEKSAVPPGIDAAAHMPEALVSRMKADGMFCVKTFFERGQGEERDLPVPRLDTMRSLVRAAHAAHMPVFLHAIGSDGHAFAIEAGVDIVAHGLWQWDAQRGSTLTPDLQKILNGVIDARMGWQPTLQVIYGFRDLFDPAYVSDPTLARVLPANLIEWYRSAEGRSFRDRMAEGLPEEVTSGDEVARWTAIQAMYAEPIARNESAVRYLAGRNARILFGTDTPAAPIYTNPPGLNGWREMRRLVAAGLTAHQVFVAATLANATALGLADEIGSVEAGKRANLILLRKDPTKDVQAYDEIVKIIIRGQVIDRVELAAKR
jgi:imidazolonepropionase-like amidohydrolase